jgi:hypothetical protein
VIKFLSGVLDKEKSEKEGGKEGEEDKACAVKTLLFCEHCKQKFAGSSFLKFLHEGSMANLNRTCL